MIITKTPAELWAHCAMQVGPEGGLAFNNDGAPEGLERCPGYEQQKVRGIVERVEWLYGDLNQGSSDPFDAAFARLVERSAEYLHFADPADIACPHCGHPRQISDQVRPVYPRLSTSAPDALFLARRREREHSEAAQASATAADRQAVALEKLVQQGDAATATELAELREQVAELRAQLGPNGHEEPPQAPRPRRRSPA